MANIVRIHVLYMHESCQRHNYWVRAVTDDGMTKEVDGHRTGSVYNDFAGLTREEARDRCLMDAATWGDFLQITPDPYVEDGVTYEPSMKLSSYQYQRDRKTKSNC